MPSDGRESLQRVMNLAEYASYDALGLAVLVASKQLPPKELAQTAAAVIASINRADNAVVEKYQDRIDGLDEKMLGTGPFRGVPFLIKDFFGHEAGRTIEFGSRLCRGMVAQHDTHLCELFKASGVNILGRSAAPEYSMSGTTESALHGNTSTPWKQGHSAGGSTGGGMAAVIAGMGHQVSEESPDFDGPGAMRSMTDVWFFGFDLRLEGYATRSGHAIGPETLEPVTLKICHSLCRTTFWAFRRFRFRWPCIPPACRSASSLEPGPRPSTSSCSSPPRSKRRCHGRDVYRRGMCRR